MLKITEATLQSKNKEPNVKLLRLTYCAFIAMILSQFLSVTGVEAQVRHTIIAASGEAAPAGDGNLSFFGVKFNDARIARVRITTGNAAPGPDDDNKNDIVMMDDFIYCEPNALP
jgi:hypothetical protein